VRCKGNPYYLICQYKFPYIPFYHHVDGNYLYHGRAINIVINLTDDEKEYYLREDDKNVIYNKMSSYQRAKIESFFGKMNAYYTQIEIL
jgi:hypothetical protein